jgi:hypothetical protein
MSSASPLKFRLFILIAAITFLKGVAILLFLPHPRAWEDSAMAINFMRTGSLFVSQYGVRNHSFLFPVYPLMIAGLYGIAGSQARLMTLFNVLLSGVTALVLAGLFPILVSRVDLEARLKGLRRCIVYISVLGFLLHPLINYYSMNNIHPFALYALTFYTLLFLGFRYFERGQKSRDLVLLGVATGANLLTRMTLVVSLVPFVLLSVADRGWSKALGRTATVISIGVLLSSPWLIRNYWVDGVVGYTSTTGEFLWRGSLKNSEGSSYLTDGRTYWTAISDEDSAKLSRMNVADQDRFFLREYLATVTNDPGHVFEMFLVKLRNFFWFRPLIANGYSTSIQRWVPLYKVVYGIVLILALLTVPLFGLRSLLVWGPIIGLGVLQSVFYVETRHRVLIEPLLIFLATLSIAKIVTEAMRDDQSYYRKLWI